MSVPECFVDGDVADWMSQDSDHVGAEVSGLVVYHPSIPRRSFVSQCDWLEERALRRTDALLEAASCRGFRFGVVDEQAAEDAGRIVDAAMGESYLESFVNDTLMVALQHVGGAFSDLARQDIKISPACAAAAVDVSPAKSFRSEKALVQYLQDGRGTWRPSVRLSVKASLDGPLSAMEGAAWKLRLALADCGPVTEWRHRMRPTRHVACSQSLRLVVG